MDNNFNFKTRHVSIVKRSSSVVNSFTSSVEFIQAMAYKLKRDTIQNFEKISEKTSLLTEQKDLAVFDYISYFQVQWLVATLIFSFSRSVFLFFAGRY